MKIVGACLVLLATIAAVRGNGLVFNWVGGRMDFSLTQNWLNGVAPPTVAADPSTIACNTFFGSPDPNNKIISQLSATTYFIGSKLFLPNNGVLRLALTDTILSFSSSTTCNPALPSYNWTGGVKPEQRNDFYCHLNWADDAMKPIPITDNNLGALVPCAGDTAVFGAEGTPTTYHTFVPNNATLVTLQTLQVNGIQITSPSGLSAVKDQVDLIDTSVPVVFGSAAALYKSTCAQYSLSDTSDNKKQCLCFSTCFPPDLEAKVVLLLKQRQMSAAQLQAAADAVTRIRSFNGKFYPSSFGLSASDVASNLNNATQKQILTTSVAANVLSSVPANSATNFSLTLNVDGSVTLIGTINATDGSLYLPGTRVVPSPLSWIATTTPTNVTQLQYVSQITLATLMANYITVQLAAQVAAAKNNLDNSSSAVVNTLVTLPNATALLNAVNNDPCFSTCASNCTDCISSIADLLQAAFGLNSTQATQLATDMANAKDSNPLQWSNTSNTINSVVNTTKALDQASASQQQNTPRPFADSTIIYFGNLGSSLLPLYQSLAPQNFPNLVRAVTTSLTSYAKIQNIGNIKVYYVDTGARRRRGTLSAGIAVSFNYSVTCVPNDTPCLTLASVRPELTSRLNQVFDGFAPIPNVCYDSTNAFNASCLKIQADNFCSQYGATNALPYLTNLTQCGYFPPLPTGGCYESDLVNARIRAGFAYNGSTVCIPPPSGDAGASSGGGGGGGLGMAAGAAGAGIAIIVIIIVVVVMRRKKAKQTSGTTKRADDRTVVAFENPMYDDHLNNNNNQAMYDSHQLHESEGLYDEPAFSTSNKVNPVYQSHEDLAGDGYLEAGKSGGGDGYLDVSPNGMGKAEDVGYLGAEEAPMESKGLSQPAYEAADEEPAYQDHAGIADTAGEANYQEAPGQDFGFGAGEEDYEYAAAE